MKQTLYQLIKNIHHFLVNTFHEYNHKLPYFLAALFALIIVVTGINLFVELTEILSTEVLAGYDTIITDYVISFRTPLLTKYFIFVTDVGDLYGYLIVISIFAVLSFLIFKRWKYVLQTTLVLILASASNTVLKRFIDRARPSLEHMVSVETLSYPSGHAMSAMAFYGFLIFLLYRFPMNIAVKMFSIVILAFLILSIGISRIYLGVHYPSDIAGGYIAGFIWVVFCILIFNLIELFKRDPST